MKNPPNHAQSRVFNWPGAGTPQRLLLGAVLAAAICAPVSSDAASGLNIVARLGQRAETKRRLRHYPDSYEQARGDFRNNARVLERELEAQGFKGKVELKRLKVPSERDKDLFIDRLYIGPKKETDAKRVMVLTGGEHGKQEGRVGSAIMSQFMREDAVSLLTRPGKRSDDMGIVLYHAVNASGYKHNRRVDEKGRDLNRNALESKEEFDAQENPEYLEHAAFLNPTGKARYQRLISPSLSFVRKIRELLAEGTEKQRLKPKVEGEPPGNPLKDAIAALKAAIAGGQYYPKWVKGLFSGGTDYAPQIELLTEDLHEVAPKAKVLVWDSIHTGYGRGLQLWLGKRLSELSKGSQAALAHIQGDYGIKINDPAEEAYPIKGSLPGYFGGQFQKEGVAVVPFMSEWGPKWRLLDKLHLLLPRKIRDKIGEDLLPGMKTLLVLMQENQAAVHKCVSERAKRKIDLAWENLFCSRSKTWRIETLDTARSKIDHIVNSLATMDLSQILEAEADTP